MNGIEATRRILEARPDTAILTLMAGGLTNTAIASRLYFSPKTVRNYVSSIFTKLHVADRPQAIIRAREAGLGKEGG